LSAYYPPNAAERKLPLERRLPPQIESADIGDVRAAVDLLAAVLVGELAI